MMRNTFTGEYVEDWQDVARRVKDTAGWRCVRCGHPHESPKERALCDEHCDPRRHTGGRLNDGKQRILTVHHLDGDKSNNSEWNTAALCQVCHLVIQGKVVMERPWRMLPHSKWFEPYAAGFYASYYLGEEISLQEAVERIDELFAVAGCVTNA